ncbi:hypothetical protein SAMN04488002_0897 [Litoreibacter janthinus]|uniref:Uncharacterized protein n=1 Tax=Litoreibacter janthinus TaxID=670154 RepID=A0A1I6G564_9RHOB|nr:hypothetical protein SAMN04488002_0897 [Litoreibacter janthinus]
MRVAGDRNPITDETPHKSLHFSYVVILLTGNLGLFTVGARLAPLIEAPMAHRMGMGGKYLALLCDH